MDTFDRLWEMMDEINNPPQAVPEGVVVTSQPTAGPSTRDPETPRYLTFDEIVNPPQEEPMQGVIMTSQTAPQAAVQGSRVPQTVPQAAGPTTRMVDLDQRLQELVQRVYGPNGSLEDQQPPVRLVFKSRYECLAVPIDRSKKYKFIGKDRLPIR